MMTRKKKGKTAIVDDVSRCLIWDYVASRRQLGMRVQLQKAEEMKCSSKIGCSDIEEKGR